MFDYLAIVKLTEKLNELLKLRQGEKRRTFDNVVPPTYTELEKVHADYLKLFESCRRSLKDGTDLDVIAKQLRTDKVEYEPVRRKLIAVANKYADHPRLKPYSDFFHAVSRYLRSPNENRTSLLLTEVEQVASEEQPDKSLFGPDPTQERRDKLVRVTDELLNDIREAWMTVAREYAETTARNATT